MMVKYDYMVITNLNAIELGVVMRDLEKDNIPFKSKMIFTDTMVTKLALVFDTMEDLVKVKLEYL